MQNSGIFLRKMIEIVAEGDTFILHFAFFILHFYRAIGSINRNLRLIKGLGGIVGLGLICNRADGLAAKTVLGIVAK